MATWGLGSTVYAQHPGRICPAQVHITAALTTRPEHCPDSLGVMPYLLH